MPDRSHDHIEAGCLASTIWSEQANNLTACHGEADVSDYLFATVAFGQVLCLECVHARRLLLGVVSDFDSVVIISTALEVDNPFADIVIHKLAHILITRLHEPGGA